MLTRSFYLSANILELSLLAKLYGIAPMGNPRYHINWVDALISRLPQAKLMAWGSLHEDDRIQLDKVYFGENITCFDDMEAAINGHNNPSAVQLAILARMIELTYPTRKVETRMVADRFISHHLLDNGVGIDSNEIILADKLWSIYRYKVMITEIRILLANLYG